MGKLNGKVALITGGSGGIGKETATTFLKEGAKVVLVDLFEESLNKVKEELESFGQVITVGADVSKEEDVKNYVQKTVEQFGQIDIFFSNAGITGKKTSLIEQTAENFDKVLAVNTRGVFLGLKYVLPIMIKQESGSVINTSSVDGLRGSPEMAPYAASKHAVVGLTKTAALEVSDNNIRINSIHPSPVNTEMMRSLEADTNPDDPESVKTTYSQAIPLKRYADSNDIVSLVLFLASDESKFITGSQYRVDGGMGAI
ncbi:SDR family NAD(P)-dependent oxidoreductase [Oceanobacillus sp. M60]